MKSCLSMRPDMLSPAAPARTWTTSVSEQPFAHSTFTGNTESFRRREGAGRVGAKYLYAVRSTEIAGRRRHPYWLRVRWSVPLLVLPASSADMLTAISPPPSCVCGRLRSSGRRRLEHSRGAGMGRAMNTGVAWSPTFMPCNPHRGVVSRSTTVSTPSRTNAFTAGRLKSALRSRGVSVKGNDPPSIKAQALACLNDCSALAHRVAS